ncbi:MAG: ribonuclease P protein component [Actinomycetota bacterium]
MLPKEMRLRAPSDFKRVYESGRSVANGFLVLYYRKGGSAQSRIGFSISKRVGSAVERNRTKRRLSEIYRLHQAEIKGPCDLVVICRPKAAQLSYQNLEKVFMELLLRSRIVSGDQ